MEMDNNSNVQTPNSTKKNNYLFNKKIGLISLICSIITLPCFILFFKISSLNINGLNLGKMLFVIPFILSIIALVTGVLSRKTTLGKIGLIISIISIVCISLLYIFGYLLLAYSFIYFMFHPMH